MRLVFIDTCGDLGSVALAEDGAVLRARTLPPRTASAQLVAELRAEMGALHWSVGSLDGIGVVSGPGSFTGVRVGMAAAKGLCEVGGVALVALSRLELMLSIGSATGGDLAVLDAGRGEFYVRSAANGMERVVKRADVKPPTGSGRLFIAEEKLLTQFEGHDVTVVEPTAADALPLALQRLTEGGIDVASADANYVRQASGLYASRQPACAPEVR